MNTLPTILLLVPVLSLPHPKPVHLPSQPSVLNNCIVENGQHGLNSIKNCTDCFDLTRTSPLSREGILHTKFCIRQFLPVASQDCLEDIEALEPDNVEKAKKVLDCFVTTAQRISAEKCIKNEGLENIIDNLTEGVICLEEIYANYSKIEQEIEPGTRTEKQDGILIFPSTSYLTTICEMVATSQEEMFSCFNCFVDTAPEDMKGNLNVTENLELIKHCSAEHLDPLFSQCTEIIQAMAENPEIDEVLGDQIFVCYEKVVTNHLVRHCSEGIDNISVDNLLGVAECRHNLHNS